MAGGYSIMTTLVISLHIFVCVVLIVLVLLQSGKEGMGVIFGGGSSTMFGSSGAGGILSKLTAFLAVIFVVTSLAYNIMSSHKPAIDSSVINKVDINIEDAAPEKPAVPENAVPAAPQSAAPAASDVKSE